MKTGIEKIRLVVIVALLLIASTVKGQQDPMFTQYNFNNQVINPAYAGTWQSMGFLVLGRYQWLGMDGGPKTVTLSMQTPTRRENVALGLNIVSDVIGKEKRLAIFGDYSYRVRVGENSFLNLGLKGGITNYRNVLSEYTQNADAEPDLASMGEMDIKWMPNFGIGGYLYSDRYFVGLSVPKVIQSEFKSGTNYSIESELRHFFLNAGIVLRLSDEVQFKPTFLTKVTLGAPVEFDLGANFLLLEKFWLGAMYRTGDSYGFIAQWVIDKKVRLGYSVDFTVTELKRYNSGSHELMISYELGARRTWKTPRMF